MDLHRRVQSFLPDGMEDDVPVRVALKSFAYNENSLLLETTNHWLRRQKDDPAEENPDKLLKQRLSIRRLSQSQQRRASVKQNYDAALHSKNKNFKRSRRCLRIFVVLSILFTSALLLTLLLCHLQLRNLVTNRMRSELNLLFKWGEFTQKSVSATTPVFTALKTQQPLNLHSELSAEFRDSILEVTHIRTAVENLIQNLPEENEARKAVLASAKKIASIVIETIGTRVLTLDGYQLSSYVIDIVDDAIDRMQGGNGTLAPASDTGTILFWPSDLFQWSYMAQNIIVNTYNASYQGVLDATEAITAITVPESESVIKVTDRLAYALVGFSGIVIVSMTIVASWHKRQASQLTKTLEEIKKSMKGNEGLLKHDSKQLQNLYKLVNGAGVVLFVLLGVIAFVELAVWFALLRLHARATTNHSVTPYSAAIGVKNIAPIGVHLPPQMLGSVEYDSPDNSIVLGVAAVASNAIHEAITVNVVELQNTGHKNEADFFAEQLQTICDIVEQTTAKALELAALRNALNMSDPSDYANFTATRDAALANVDLESAQKARDNIDTTAAEIVLFVSTSFFELQRDVRTLAVTLITASSALLLVLVAVLLPTLAVQDRRLVRARRLEVNLSLWTLERILAHSEGRQLLASYTASRFSDELLLWIVAYRAVLCGCSPDALRQYLEHCEVDRIRKNKAGLSDDESLKLTMDTEMTKADLHIRPKHGVSVAVAAWLMSHFLSLGSKWQLNISARLMSQVRDAWRDELHGLDKCTDDCDYIFLMKEVPRYVSLRFLKHLAQVDQVVRSLTYGNIVREFVQTPVFRRFAKQQHQLLIIQMEALQHIATSRA
ncbi:MAG: hypothetical protein MHM6MM_003902 [Cercozoa sp. M6MM]